MRVQPKVRGIEPFLAGSRPSRLHKRRRRERDARRERWLAWRTEGLDSVAMRALPSAGCPTTCTAQTKSIVHEPAQPEMLERYQ